MQRRPQLLKLVALAALMALSGLLSYRFSERQGLQALRLEARHKLDLTAAAVDGVVHRLEHVPATIELNPDVHAMLRDHTAPEAARRVNAYLEAYNREVGSIAIYVLDRAGIVRAASNWNRSDSFVGEDLSFRTYFRKAIAGQPARHFAIGTTDGTPGYYVAQPVRDAGEVVGVTVIKIGLAAIDKAWQSLALPALIADQNGVVILTPVDDWRYTALLPLTPEIAAEVERTRLYNQRTPTPFPVALDPDVGMSGVVVKLRDPAEAGAPGRGARRYLALGWPLERTGWWLMVFADLRPVLNQAVSHAALGALSSGFLAMLLAFVAQRRRILRHRLEAQALLERANAELEDTVARRTADLTRANERLRKENAERLQAERTLRAAQDELVQAAKLAVLGQLATGITHELAQPLGAIRTLSGNAEEFLRRGRVDTASKNLSIISRLADQMGAIISPLKTFARKSPAVPARVDIAHAVGNALLLLDQKLQRNGIAVIRRIEPDGLTAWCDQIRLEQVLINLIGNAADAMAGQAQRSLEISTRAPADGPVELCVTDTGPGLPPEVQARLFEPFFTTKPAGEGLGLGLAISRDIVREFGGELAATSAPGGGACFRLTLPARPPETAP